MGVSVDYLHRHPSTGRLSYRRAYPRELRPLIPGQPVQLKRSLGAKSLIAPGALDRFGQAADEYERVTVKARKAATRTFDRLEIPTIAYLAALHERSLHEGSEAAVKSGRAEQNLEGWRWLLDEFRQWRVEQDADAAEKQWGRSARRLLDAEGIVLDPADTSSFGELCLALNDAAIAASGPAKDRLQGDVIAVPPEPTRPNKAIQSPKGLTFSSLVELLHASPVHKISETTKETGRTAIRYFREAFGDILPGEITRQMVTEWLELLSRKPKAPQSTDRKLTLRELVERYEGQEVPRLSGRTLEQYVTALSARWGQAVRDGFIEESIPNPFTNRKIPRDPRPEVAQEFSRHELKAIFSLPIFTEGDRPPGGKGEASYWMPLLLLWTGARPEEIAQLLTSDVSKDPESGRWLLRITDEGKHPHKGQRLLKTSRTFSGRRTFPLPQVLLDLNFVGYVEDLRAAGERALFPDLRPKGRRGYLYAQWATWWGKHLRANDILPKGVARKPAREFRHVWATAARASGIARETREYIQGHAPPGATANEVYGSKEPLGRQIDTLRFDGLDWRDLRPWTPRT